MKRGFTLTESEKNRIKSIYGTINEGDSDSDYQLDSVEKIRGFQDWMDGKFGKWAESIKSPGSFYKVGQREKYGWGFMRAQTKKAWDAHKDEYLKEKGLVKKDEVKQVVEPPKEEVKTDNDLVKTDKEKSSIETNKTGESNMTYQKTQQSDMKVDPFANKGTYSKDEQGFKDWYKGVYGQDLGNATVEIKGDKAKVIKNNKSLEYPYNDTLKSWNTTGKIPTKIVIKTKEG